MIDTPLAAPPPSAPAPIGRAARMAPLLVPLACTGALFALALLPRLTREPNLVHSTRALASILLVWLLFLALRVVGTGRRLAIEPRVLAAHYVQTFNQSAILAWWALYVPLVADELVLVAAQLVFMYALDALLSFTRRGSWVLGFGIIPMTLSTNFFLWFRDEWFFFQYGMIALVLLGKELVRWQKDGRSAHIFNPSSFALSIASIALIATGGTDMTWGPDQAVTIGRPPGMLVVMFAIGLVPQLRFAVTSMTLAAVATVLACDLVYFQATGAFLFTTTVIPPAVFFGSIFLFTDPATSPRSTAGRLIFGALYGLLVCVLFVLFQRWDIPEFYDKILPIPVLNLSVRAIDRLVAALRPLTALDRAPRRVNLVMIGLWSALFAAMELGGLMDARFPGARPEWWAEAVARGVPKARKTYVGLLEYNAGQGDAAAADQLGWALLDGKFTPVDPVRAIDVFLRAADLGFPSAPADAVTAYLAHFGDNQPGPRLLPAFQWVWREAARGDPRCSYIVGFALSQGRCMERDPARAVPFLERACHGGWRDALPLLADLYERGDGVPRDAARAADLRRQAAELPPSPGPHDPPAPLPGR